MLISRWKKIGLVIAAACLLVCVVLLQADIDPKRHQFEPGKGPITVGGKPSNLMMELPSQMIAATVVGLKEVVANLLWIRADEFFHQGNYDAIVPLVRLATWLDPHQLDIYMTGAWHLDYNFTDSDQRSDRRYIPASIALLEEGIQNNPTLFDLYFELGWVHYYQKIKDYDKAVYWIEKARRQEAIDPQTGKRGPRPGYVDRMLAHAYEKAGNIRMAEKTWREAVRFGQYLARINKKDPSYELEVTIPQRNLDMLLMRQEWRKTSWKPVIDVQFNPVVKRIAPKVLMISGTVRILNRDDYLKAWPGERPPFVADTLVMARRGWIDGARMDIQLADRGYKRPVLKSFNWQIDRNVTIMVDSVRISDGSFKIKIDMSEDPNIYSFHADEYELVLSLDPTTFPDYIQDRTGWIGEGITDKNFLDTKTRPGIRMIRKVIELRREDIVGVDS